MPDVFGKVHPLKSFRQPFYSPPRLQRSALAIAHTKSKVDSHKKYVNARQAGLDSTGQCAKLNKRLQWPQLCIRGAADEQQSGRQVA